MSLDRINEKINNVFIDKEGTYYAVTDYGRVFTRTPTHGWFENDWFSELQKELNEPN